MRTMRVSLPNFKKKERGKGIRGKIKADEIFESDNDNEEKNIRKKKSKK